MYFFTQLTNTKRQTHREIIISLTPIRGRIQSTAIYDRTQELHVAFSGICKFCMQSGILMKACELFLELYTGFFENMASEISRCVLYLTCLENALTMHYDLHKTAFDHVNNASTNKFINHNSLVLK